MTRAAEPGCSADLQKLKATDRKTVYIETSIVSYLTAKPSSNLVSAAWQKTTIDRWDTRRSQFDLFASATVIEEASR